jgi:hypothetical protein
MYVAGLPDFSCSNIPKSGKYTKYSGNVPKVKKYGKWPIKYQMDIKYTDIFHCKTL